MSNLSEIYSLIDGLKKRGLAIDSSLQQEANELEQEYIKSTVLPALHDTLTNLLRPLRGEFVLVCEHRTDTPLSVILSRETELSSLLDDAIVLTNELSESSVEDLNTDNDIVEENQQSDEEIDNTSISFRKKAKSVRFSVTFDDGFKAEGSTAKDTMIAAIRHMGFDNVARFRGKTFMGYNFVDRRLRTDENKPWQTRVGDWYVYTNMGNNTKKVMLQQVAQFLGYKIVISDNIDSDTQQQPLVVEKPKGRRAVFSLNGKSPLDKRNSVLAVVKLFVRNRPNATFNEIQRAFPANLQGSYGVVMSIDEIDDRRRRGQQIDNRYFLDPSDIFTSADGVPFAVCNQWGDQFSAFQEHIKRFGWTLTEV